jgi:ADP-ribosylglycohydrolase
LFGLAYGDALGAPTEFLSMEEIVRRYGPGGPTDLVGAPARVTDDTQMALAVGWALRDVTAAGADTASAGVAGGATTAASESTGLAVDPDAFATALRRRFVGWLLSPDNNRAPGNTCLTACGALLENVPWVEATIIGSKGCGANMRVTPCGLVPGFDLDVLAGVAQLQSALTHGHPTALAASELTAYATRILRDGAALATVPEALRQRCFEQRTVYREDWLGDLWRRAHDPDPESFISRGWDECAAALDRLVAALRADDGPADPCEATGAGWVAEEALATGLYCALLRTDDPVAALARAATTSGDSDSIACLTGAFLGASRGMPIWPRAWLDRIEYADLLADLGAAWD